MPTGIINLALGLAMQVGAPGPSEVPYVQPPANAYSQYGFSGSAEQRHPFETQMNWVHGYHQEIPPYGGHHVYRPYNYKDVLSQSQTAAGWGERPMMPYSQQFWHRYNDQATMLKMSRAQPVPLPYTLGQHVTPQPQIWVGHPHGLQVPAQQVVWPQTTNTPVQNASQSTIILPPNLSDPLQAPAIP